MGFSSHIIYYLGDSRYKVSLSRGNRVRPSLGTRSPWFQVLTYECTVYTLSYYLRSGLFAQLPREHAFSITVHSDLKILYGSF